MVEGREVAQSLHPLPAVGGEMQPPGQRLRLPSFCRSRSTRMQTAVPHAVEAAEVGLTSLVATSSAWQGKTDPCTRISTTHTTGNSTRTHTHNPQPHRRVFALVLPSRHARTRGRNPGERRGCSQSNLCPARPGEKEPALPGDPPRRLALPRIGLVTTS